MISFDCFTPREGIPIYLQIVLHIKRGIATQEICDGDELPSRRVLSALLGVNPNTVQKAYRQLEEENLVISAQGSKSNMRLTEEVVSNIRKELLLTDVSDAVLSLKQLGISMEEAVVLLQKLWGEV